MSWLLRVTVRSDDFDQVSALLWDSGTNGIAELDAPNNTDAPNNADNVLVVAGFEVEQVGLEAVALLAAHSATLELLDDSAWAGPPARSISVGGVTVTIDAGHAFGHGEHPTTQLVCDTLPALVGHGSSFLDIGTGSGVLAIAASKLGASSVVAIDIDPVAIESARANALANEVAIEIGDQSLADIGKTNGRFDLVAANMLLSNLRPIAGDILNLVGDTLVVSGCLAEQVDEVLELFVPLRPVSQLDRDGWACVVLR